MSFVSATIDNIALNETFGTTSWSSIYAYYNCTSSGPSVNLSKGFKFSALSTPTWYCYYTAWGGAVGVNYLPSSGTEINTPKGLESLTSSGSIVPTDYHFLETFTSRVIQPDDKIDFYCSMNDTGFTSLSTNTSLYLILSAYSESGNETIISLRNGGCAWENTSYYPSVSLSSKCIEITNITGNDCSYFTHQNFTGQNLIDKGLNLVNKNIFVVDEYFREKDLSHQVFWLDDILIYNETAPPSPITATYYEDFEDLNFTYPTPLVSYQCMFGSYSFIGTTTNPVYTTCHADPTGNTIAIGNTSILGSGKGLKLVYNYSSGSPEKTNPINFNLPTNFTITNTSYLSFDWYAIAQTWNPSGGGGYFGDAVSIFLKNPITYKVITLSSCSANSSVYLASPVDSVVSVTPHTCIINGSMWDNSTLNFTFNNIQLWTRFYGDASSDELLIAIDNIQLNATTSGNITPTPPVNVTPNLTQQVYFNETFTLNKLFTYDTPNNCSLSCYLDPVCFYEEPLALDNDWYCWRSYNDILGIPSYARYSNLSDTAKIETKQGLKVYTTSSFNLGHDAQNYFVTFFDAFTMQDNDTISWTCNMPSQTNGNDIYLSMGNLANETLMISMGLDGIGTRCNYTGLPTTHCCDLTTIVGTANDCMTSTKTKVAITKKQIVDACPYIDDFDFYQTNHIGLWTTTYNTFSSQEYYFDDLTISSGYSQIANNSQPIIASVVASPNPANASESVSWDVIIWDDDFDYQRYTGFDCENDGILEYPITLNGSSQFNCTYGTIGTYTGKAFVSDLTYYPIMTEATGSVDIRDLTLSRGGNCDGFVAPTCEGNCIFFDDFNYDYSVECNQWEGTNKHPTNNMLILENMNASENYLRRKFADVNNWEYTTFSFSFDYTINTPEKIYMNIWNEDTSKLLTYIYWDTYVLYSLDSVTPYVVPISRYTYNEKYTMYGIVNFTANPKKITYVIYNSTGQNSTYQVEFFDDTNTINSVTFDIPTTATNMTIDNFLVTKGTINTNGTEPFSPSSTYVYNGDLFCAINWTSAKPKFSPDNCAERGYDQPALLGLCPVRACIADTGSFIFNSALNNIFQTILILIAIILFAPILVLLVKRK